MDALPVAVFVVDERLCPVYLNYEARALVSKPADASSEPLNEGDLLHLLNAKTGGLKPALPQGTVSGSPRLAG